MEQEIWDNMIKSRLRPMEHIKGRLLLLEIINAQYQNVASRFDKETFPPITIEDAKAGVSKIVEEIKIATELIQDFVELGDDWNILSSIVNNFKHFVLVAERSLIVSISDFELYRFILFQGIGLHLNAYLQFKEKFDSFEACNDSVINALKCIPAVEEHVIKRTRKKGSKNATDVKYSPGRDLYKEAIVIAKSKWEKGSPLKHHQMKKYLIKEYQVAGKHPFAKFDSDCGYTEKGLLERLKGLAKEMNRPDLISGQRKSS